MEYARIYKPARYSYIFRKIKRQKGGLVSSQIACKYSEMLFKGRDEKESFDAKLLVRF